MSSLEIGEDHPLSLELSSLRATVARYQHEAHAASVKLQRHSLESSHAIEEAHALRQENARLREEISTLRANPDVTPHPATLQIPELTLALRKLSDKLTATEEILATRTTELAHAQSDLLQAQSDADAAHALTVQAYIVVEHGRARERELERKVHAAEEERRLADLVVQEYADLVRNLEGRNSKGSRSPSISVNDNATSANVSLVERLAEGKLGLQRLLSEHGAEMERMASQITRLADENELLKTKLDVERKRSEADRESLAKVLLELDKHQTDDNTATKMVSRYMKFSQSTIDSLQQAMDNLRTRHASTEATLNGQIEYLRKALSSERRQAEKLRNTLDELSEDISRETYGRRREFALRLSFLSREESLAENLRRWLRRSKETLERSVAQDENHDYAARKVFGQMIQDAENLLESLNGQPSAEDDTPASIARLLAAQDAVKTLTAELREETDKRLYLQRQFAELTPDGSGATADSTVIFALRQPPSRHASLVNLPIDHESPAGGPSHSFRVHREDVEVAQLPATSPTPPTDSQVQPSPVTEPSVTSHVNDADTTLPDTHAYPDIPDSDPDISSSAEHPSPTGSLASNLFISGQAPAVMDGLLSQNMESGSGSSEETSSGDVLASLEGELPCNISSAGLTGNNSRNGDIETKSDLPTEVISEARDQMRTIEPEPCIVDMESTIIDTLPIPTMPTHNVDAAPAHVDPEIPSVKAPEDPLHSRVQSIEEQTDASDLLFSSSMPLSNSVTTPPHLDKQALLADLSRVKDRYQELQRSYRDCSISLKDLKKDVNSLPDSLEMSSVIRTAVERLNDFNEDARVELEIRVADEERILMGYQTLLSVAGALDEEMDEEKLRQDVTAFIDGSDKAVSRAKQQLTRKLDDLEHDIASIKRALHDVTADADERRPTTPSKHGQGWSSWTAGILGGGATRPVSPAPTFGSVMTSPRARQTSFSLKHKPSLPLDLSRNRTPADEKPDPFATLGLRIPMPMHVMPTPSPSKGGIFFSSISSGAPRTPKPRVSSASLFSLGIGTRGSSFNLGTPNSTKPPSSGLATETEHGERSEKYSEGEGSESDIE